MPTKRATPYVLLAKRSTERERHERPKDVASSRGESSSEAYRSMVCGFCANPSREGRAESPGTWGRVELPESALGDVRRLASFVAFGTPLSPDVTV